MSTAQIVQWRCGNCGIASPAGLMACQACGGFRPDRNTNRTRLLEAALSNQGNRDVQNNVNNIAIQGDVSFGTYFTQSVEEDEQEERSCKPEKDLLRSFLLTTCGVAMWTGITAIAFSMLFFAGILVKAFFFS